MPAGRGRRRRQFATVVVVGGGAGVDEKLNKIWKITKAGRKEKRRRERERERRSLASEVSWSAACRWSVGRPLRRSVSRSVMPYILTRRYARRVRGINSFYGPI